MDGQRFDQIVKSLSATGTRRGLLHWLIAMTVGGTFVLPVDSHRLAWLDQDEAEAHGRRRRRKKRHKHGRGRRRKQHKHQKKCKPKSRAKTCADRCGSVTNNCKKRVDCGSCACDPLCPICQICQEEPGVVGVCIPDPAQQGDACGEPGQVCQADGSCACDVCDSGCPFTSVQEAIAAAEPGDTITICAGTLLGADAVADIDKDLTIIGQGDDDDPAANTILDADDTATVVRVRSARTVSLQGLRISGGRESSNGGGVNNAGDLTLTGCTVTGNNGSPAIGGPGGIFSTGPLTMTDCTVSANVTQSANAGGIRAIGGPLSLTRCTITANEGFVGGIAIDVITATITDTTIAGNHANAPGSANGGGIRVDQGTLHLIGSSVTGNTASTIGGGIVNADGTVTLTESSVTDNTAGTTGGGIQNDGGTMALDAASLVCDNSPDQCAGFSDPACQDTCPP